MHQLFQLPSDRDWFISQGLASASRATVIAGTGVDTEYWSPTVEEESEELCVLFAARLFREKGIESFVEVARRLRRPGIRFIVAGAPDLGVSSSVRPEDLAEWADSGLVDYRGQVDDMRALYREADLFVFPSLHPEGTPKVLIEAAACGVPSVASNQAGCREVVGDSAGVIVDATDVDELTRTVERLLTNSLLRRKYSTGARRRAVDEFSLEVVLSRLMPILAPDSAHQ